MKMSRILCIDDDEDFLLSMRLDLEGIFDVYAARTIGEALDLLGRSNFDLVLLDIELGPENGIECIGRIRSVKPLVDIVMLSACRNPRAVVSSIQAGAIDYLTKPFEMEELKAIIERKRNQQKLFERYDALIEAQNSNGYNGGIIFRSQSIAKLLLQSQQLKGHLANVLIVGETGTGKELFARYLHKLEGSPSRPFVAINCAAIPATLIETELFGSEAGAYTGAIKRRIGRFELADGGDIFLDEVGVLKQDLQAKILRVLQEKEFCRLGGNETVKANFRVIAATNEPLELKVSQGDFRMDLYHRLRVIQLTIPSLRERVEDIPVLINYYLEKFARNEAPKRISSAAMGKLMSYNWPGNVRELANIVQSLTILAKGETIDEGAFPSWALNGCARENENFKMGVLPSASEITIEELKDYIARAERFYIEHVIMATGGDKTKAATRLGIARTTLYAKMKNLSMPTSKFSSVC